MKKRKFSLPTYLFRLFRLLNNTCQGQQGGGVFLQNYMDTSFEPLIVIQFPGHKLSTLHLLFWLMIFQRLTGGGMGFPGLSHKHLKLKGNYGRNRKIRL